MRQPWELTPDTQDEVWGFEYLPTVCQVADPDRWRDCWGSAWRAGTREQAQALAEKWASRNACRRTRVYRVDLRQEAP